MKVLLSFLLFSVCCIASAQDYPFFAIANGGLVQSDKSGTVSITDSLVTIKTNGSETTVPFKITSHSGDTYNYNGGSFTITKEKGKVSVVGQSGGKKYNTVINMTMPNGLGGVMTLKYLCLID